MKPETWLILGILSLVLLYYNFKLNSWLYEWLKRKAAWRKTIRQNRATIQAFLENDFKDTKIEQLEPLIKEIKQSGHISQVSKGFEESLSKHLKTAYIKLEELKATEHVSVLESRKYALELQIKELEQAKRRISQSQNDRLDEVKADLDVENNSVFLTEDLSDEQITILKEEDYKQVNEYDITAGQIVTALVKPPLNHSTTHEFLVWSTTNLLKNEFEDAEDIQEHQTRDADITFKYHGKYYALEIETGTGLEKPRQMADKAKYLNQKYKNRWMFIVSNKNLVPKYRKYGLATPRNQVTEKLTELLENRHPSKTSGKAPLSTKIKRKEHLK